MHLKILFGILLVGAFTDVLTTTEFVYKDCEYKYLKKCNNVLMSSYKVNNKHDVSEDVLMQMYCNGFQHYANCLSTTYSCKGLFIDLNRLMILQHTIIDKKLGICPQHNVEALRKLAAADLHLKNSHATNVDADNFEKCAEDIHHKCATKMAHDFKDDNRMCYGVRNFVACYKDPGIPCDAKIYKDFNSVLQSLANHLLAMFKEKTGIMPNC